MFTEDYTLAVISAKNKYLFLKKNPLGYMMSSLLAGFFVGLGVLLSYSIGGQLNGQPYSKVIMGVAFGVALSLVVMAGAELFTGNNFVMSAGVFTKKVKLTHALSIWGVCWIANFVGAIILALLFWATGLNSGSVAQFIASSAYTKMTMPFFNLLFRSVLCNILVCLAIWCTFRCKSESGKLTMVFWCIFAFITTGFEHCVANMSVLTIALTNPCSYSLGFGGYVYNLVVSTIGNMIGGILVAGAYYLISKQKNETT